MQWILIAITMSANGQPYDFHQIASFETRAVCQYAPEALRTRPVDTYAGEVLDEQGKWVVTFRCVPTTEIALREELDVQDNAALSLAGKSEYVAPWWRERVDHRRTIGTD